MGIEASEKDSATLLQQVKTDTSSTGQPIVEWQVVGTFKCAAGSPHGSFNVVSPGGVFPDTRIFMTSSTLSFQEGMRVRLNGIDWMIIDVGLGRTLYGCGKVLFRRLRCSEVLGE